MTFVGTPGTSFVSCGHYSLYRPRILYPVRRERVQQRVNIEYLALYVLARLCLYADWCYLFPVVLQIVLQHSFLQYDTFFTVDTRTLFSFLLPRHFLR